MAIDHATTSLGEFLQRYRFDTAVRHDPYPHYDLIREEAPIWRAPSGVRYLSRYEDIASLMRNADIYYDPLRSNRVQADIASDPGTSVEKREYVEQHRSMGDLDVPDHPRVRGAAADFFSTRAASNMLPKIRQTATKLLKECLARGTFDIVNDLALLVPVHIVIGQTYDLALDESDEIARLIPGYLHSLEADIDVESKSELQAPFYSYVANLIERRRAVRGDDVLSALVTSCDKGEINEHELFATYVVLLHGGFDTTRNLISNGVLQLLRHPDQYAALRRQPEIALSLVDEVLRFDPPAPMSRPRAVAKEMSLYGTTLDVGEQIVPLFASANRDPRQFEKADCFDISRRPNRHLGFGHGSHLCVGRPLARAEGRAVFEALAAAPELHLAVEEEELDYRPEILQRSLISLPVNRGTR
jgi:cytochrome P450